VSAIIESITIPKGHEGFFSGRKLSSFKVEDNCLEWKKVSDNHILVFDLDKQPHIGDITLCYHEKLINPQTPIAKMYLGPAANYSG